MNRGCTDSPSSSGEHRYHWDQKKKDTFFLCLSFTVLENICVESDIIKLLSYSLPKLSLFSLLTDNSISFVTSQIGWRPIPVPIFSTEKCEMETLHYT